jgi:uncharacterized membrane protein HdeD (DUF308 family)
MQLQEGEQELARIWKTTALRGALGIAFAAVILIWPSIGLATLIALFGAFALVSGVSTIAGAFSVPFTRGRRAWLVLEGLLGVAVGVAVVVWPDLSALGLLYAIGFWAIALGVFEIAIAFVLPLSGGPSLVAGLGGLLSIAFGAIMFAHPGAGAVRARAPARGRRARRTPAAARDGEAVDARLEEVSEMQAIDPGLASALVAMCAGALMVQAGLAKRRLERRPQRVRRERRRRR